MTQPNDPAENPTPATPPVPPAPPAPVNPPAAAGATSAEEGKQLAMIAHLLNCIFLVPLILYLVKKGQDAFLDSQAKEASNFALTCLIGHVAVDVCEIILHFPLAGCVFGLASLGIFILQLVLGIQNGMKARDGVGSTYPFRIEFIK